MDVVVMPLTALGVSVLLRASFILAVKPSLGLVTRCQVLFRVCNLIRLIIWNRTGSLKNIRRKCFKFWCWIHLIRACVKNWQLFGFGVQPKWDNTRLVQKLIGLKFIGGLLFQIWGGISSLVFWHSVDSLFVNLLLYQI